MYWHWRKSKIKKLEMLLSIIQSEYQRRIIEEGMARIVTCAGFLSEEEIWNRQNQNVNSIGNLILHLEGNVRQYIIAGIGNEKDNRTRDKEFDPSNQSEGQPLINKLNQTVIESYNVIQNLVLDNLTEKRKVQGFDETVMSIIIHVIEHFSYHVGQITYYTKLIKDVDTKYYEGLDLNIT